MGPILRVRGPQVRYDYVTISREHRSGGRDPIVKVVIRLPSESLREIDEEMKRREESHGITYAAYNEEDTDNVTDFSDDLSSLDMELNKVLMSSTTTSVGGNLTQPDVPKAAPVKDEPEHKGSSAAETEGLGGTMVDAARSGFESGAARAGSGDEYRTIPKNLTEIIKKELTNDDEDIGMIEKMIFTLKDPLSAIKISLPVKASICMHFECFDFETFCIFNKIPEGIKYVTRKDLVKKNYEMKKYDKERNELREKLRQQPRNSRSINLQLQKLQRNLTIPAYTAKFNPYSFPSPKVPSYKCPICDRLFALHQLYISDAYNFFVKTTPLDINRVELVDMIKYRILDDRPASMIPLGKNGGGEEEEIIVLSDEEDDEFDSDSNRNGNRNGNGNGNGIHGNGSGTGTGTGTVKESNRHTPNKLYNRDNSEDIFDDGLDQELLSLGTKGIGSWDDPVTLD